MSPNDFEATFNLEPEAVEQATSSIQSKTAAVDPMASVRKFMHLLPTDMPLPEIKIEDTPSKGWLGRCVYTYGSPSTTIHLQKVILTDQDTLDRVVAHELCHHAEFLESAQAAAAKGWSPKQHAAMDKFLRRPHGSQFQAWATKFNAVYGAGFITERSDEAMVVSEASRDINVLLWRAEGRSIRWCYTMRPSARQLEYIKQNLAHGPDTYRYVKTRDVDFAQGSSVGKGWSYTHVDGLNEKLQKLWDSGVEVKVASIRTADAVVGDPAQDVRLIDWLTRHKVPVVDGVATFYHATPTTTAPVIRTQGLHAGSLLERDPHRAVFQARRDRDLPPEAITCFEVTVPLSDLRTGTIWASTTRVVPPARLREVGFSHKDASASGETIVDGVYSMPLDDAIAEHENLVGVLESSDPESLAEAAKEQGAELKDMLEAKKKTAAGDTLTDAAALTAFMDEFLDAHLDGGTVEALLVSDMDARLSFLAGPDLQGDDDAFMSFSEAFNKRVVTSRYPIAKVNGGVLARWALAKLGADVAFPITATMRTQGLTLPPKLSAAQIASGELDRLLQGPKNSLYWFWALRLWATRNYPQVGIEGSSRLAFKLDEDHAFKIAKNAAGVAQNLTESHVAQNLHDLPITQVHHVVKEGAALVVDFAHELNEAHFHRDFGLSFHDFAESVAEMAGAGLDEKKAIESSMPPKAAELLDNLRRHRLPVSDLIFEHQWGDFKGHAVILDYGLSHEVFQEHYRKGAKFLQPKQASAFVIPPKLAPHVQVVGGLGSASQWHTKVWLGNSGTTDHTEVGAVAFDPATSTVVPIASSDDHRNGWELIQHLVGRKIIPKLPYTIIFLVSNFVDTDNPESLAKDLAAFTAWRALGGPNTMVASRYSAGRGFKVSMDDFIKAKGKVNTSYPVGKLTPLGDRLVRSLDTLAKAYGKMHLSKAHVPTKAIARAGREAMEAFEHSNLCKWNSVQAAKQSLMALEAGGDPTAFEEAIFTANGLKNQIHNMLRRLGENQFFDRDLIEVFGDPAAARTAFDSLADVS